MVAIFALILAAIAIVVFKKIMSPRTDFDEGRTLYNEDTPLSDSGLMDESADVEALLGWRLLFHHLRTIF